VDNSAERPAQSVTQHPNNFYLAASSAGGKRPGSGGKKSREVTVTSEHILNLTASSADAAWLTASCFDVAANGPRLCLTELDTASRIGFSTERRKTN
jgi:hypothetical protein